MVGLMMNTKFDKESFLIVIILLSIFSSSNCIQQAPGRYGAR